MLVRVGGRGVVEAVWMVGVGRGVGRRCCVGVSVSIESESERGFGSSEECFFFRLTIRTLVTVVLIVELAHAVDG